MNVKCIMFERKDAPDGKEFTKVGTEERFTWEELPVGAMRYSPANPADYGSDAWKALPEEERTKGHLLVLCPNTEGDDRGRCWWDIDNCSSNGAGWTRTGTPPNITVRPSIVFPPNGYHGFLTEGELVPV